MRSSSRQCQTCSSGSTAQMGLSECLLRKLGGGSIYVFCVAWQRDRDRPPWVGCVQCRFFNVLTHRIRCLVFDGHMHLRQVKLSSCTCLSHQQARNIRHLCCVADIVHAPSNNELRSLRQQAMSLTL